MGFASGSITFRRFAVSGKVPGHDAILDALAAHAWKPNEFGVPDEVEYGWCGSRHVLDGRFSYEHNVFAECFHFALRLNVNKVPGDIRKAWQAQEEEAVAATNPSGFLSKKQRMDVRELIRAKVDEAMKSGRYVKARAIPILWDLESGVLYTNVPAGHLDKLHEIFERSFSLQLREMTAGDLAMSAMGDVGAWEDLRSTKFVSGPEGQSQQPEYPWVAKSADPKGFLGNEFLLWLWWRGDVDNGTVGDASFIIDRKLNMACAYGQTGADAFAGDGPNRMPEALKALAQGKVPRRLGLILETGGMQAEFQLHAETFAVAGLKLPQVDEAESARALFEERVAMLRKTCAGIDALYGRFLADRRKAWDGTVRGIRTWIARKQGSTTAPATTAA
jgi:hypothetical protein